jgi:exopolyphosphatase/guanosine-5'-triphosphate,3'-diphosphate pyrophosphatase
VVHASHVDRVSGSTLSLAELDAAIDRFLELDLAGRRALPGMLPQRADILPAGALVLSESLVALGVAEGYLEANDLLLGYLLMERAAPATE